MRAAWRRFWRMIIYRETDSVEYVLALLLSWWAVYTYYYALFPALAALNVQPSTTLGKMQAVASLIIWASFIMAMFFAQIVGVVFDLLILRLIGALGSTIVWTTLTWFLLANITTSPVWGGFSILAIVSFWVFSRLIFDAATILSVMVLRQRNGPAPENM